MFKLLRKIKGQSTLEYAVLIIIIIGALLSIQVYCKRGLQGRIRSATDDIGEQFSPGNTGYIQQTTVNSSVHDKYTKGHANSEILSENTGVDMNQDILNVDQEFWGKVTP